MTATYEQPQDVVTRVRFFDGQYLQDQDFVDDQHYHIDRQRRHNRQLHVAGVADGLAVTRVADNPTRVLVAPGTAVDAEGRLIVLPSDPPDARTVNLTDVRGRTVNLYLVYQEVEASPQASGAADFGRWREQPLLAVVDVQAAHNFPHPPVLLARVVLNNQGVERIETDLVAYSGLRLPGPQTVEPTLRTTAAGPVELTAALTVGGNLAVGGGHAAQRLVVTGEVGAANREAENKLTYGGQLAIKGPSAQLDFVDTNGTDWALHVNDGALYFVREPWEHQDLVLDGKGNVGIGTAAPGAKLHVTGDQMLGGSLSFGKVVRQMLNLWDKNYGIGVQSSTLYARSDKNFAWYQGGTHADSELGPGTAGKALMVLHDGNLGVGVGSAGQRLVVSGTVSTSARDADNKLTTAGQVAIKGPTAQLDFLDTNNTDWAISVNDGKLSFVREPWVATDLVLDGKGNVGLGTDAPTTRLDVRGAVSITLPTQNPGGDAQHITLGTGLAGFGLQNNGFHYARAETAFAWYQGGSHRPARGDAGPGGTMVMSLGGGNLGLGLPDQQMATQRLVVFGPQGAASRDRDNKLANGGQLAIKGQVAQLDLIDINSISWALQARDRKLRFVREPFETAMTIDDRSNVVIGGDVAHAKLEVMGTTQITGRDAYLVFEGQLANNQVQTWSIIPEWGLAGRNLAFKHGSYPTSFWIQPAGGYGQASDGRLKTDVAPLAGVLDDVLRLRPSSYRFTAAGPDGRPAIGFVAQEVGEVFPELVQEHDGTLGLSYSDFSVLAIAALQEQHQLITELQAQVRELAAAAGGAR